MPAKLLTQIKAVSVARPDMMYCCSLFEERGSGERFVCLDWAIDSELAVVYDVPLRDVDTVASLMRMVADYAYKLDLRGSAGETTIRP